MKKLIAAIFLIKITLASGQVGIGTTTPSGMLHVKPTSSSAIIIDPYGTSSGNTGEIQFRELSGNGTNHTGFKAPDNISGDLIFTLPSTDGASGQSMSTDGSGTLNWTSPGIGVWEEIGRKRLTAASDAITIDGSNSYTASFEDNFSTYVSQANADAAWPSSDVAEVRVNATNDNIDFRAVSDNTNNSLSYDLQQALGAGTNANSTGWVLRFRLNFSALPGGGDGAKMFIGLHDVDYNTDNATNQDFIGATVRNSGVNNFYTAVDTDNSDPNSSTLSPDGTQNFTWATSTDYYFEIIRTSATSYTVEMFTNSDYSTGSQGQISGTCAASTDNLRYIKISNKRNVDAGEMTGIIDDIQFWTGVTTLSGFPVRRHLKILGHLKQNGNTKGCMTFNGDAGTSYALRRSENGGESTLANQLCGPQIGGSASTAYDMFFVQNVINSPSHEKLSISEVVEANAAGAGNAPNRNEYASKWINTSNSITSLTISNQGSGDFAVGSEVVVLGYDPDCPGSGGIDLTDLKAYYKFNETSGNLINEAGNVGSAASLGSSADGTNTSVSQNVGGKIGSAYDYNGTSSFSQLGSSTSQFNFIHNTSAKWTIAFWMKLNATDRGTFDRIFNNSVATGTPGIVVALDDLGPTDHVLSISTRNTTGGQEIVGYNSSNNFIPKNTSTWHFYVITYDQSLASNNLNVYRDAGNLESASKTANTPTNGNASFPMYLCRLPSASANYPNILLDEMSVWNRVLTNCEIEYLYNIGNGNEL